MKYILMMNCPKTGYDTFGAWPKKDIQANIAFMHGFNKALSESGALVGAEGLADPKQAKVIAYTMEWGRSRASTPFHPPYAEMRKVMREVTAGLLEFCLRAT